MRLLNALCFASISIIAAYSPVSAETLRTEYQMIELDQLAGGLSNPWALALLPDGRFLVTEKQSRLVLIGNGELTTVEGTPEVMARDQGGLLDVVIHPEFESNGLVYLT